MNTITSVFSNCFPYAVQKPSCPTVINAALGIIAACGLTVAVLGICSYLPPYARWVGFSVTGVAVAGLLAHCVYRKKRESNPPLLCKLAPEVQVKRSIFTYLKRPIKKAIEEVHEKENSDNIYQLLTKGKIDQTLLNQYGGLFLYCAALTGNLVLLKALIEKKVKNDFINDEGYTPLHAATYAEETEIVKYLLLHCEESKKQVNKQTTYRKETPLHLSTKSEITELLLKNEASLTIKDEDENTPLESALYHRWKGKEILKILSEKSTYTEKMQILDKYFYNTRYFCNHVTMSHKEFVERFIEYVLSSEDFEVADEHGRTLLLNVYLRNDFDFAELLLEKGANPNVVDNNGQNLFHLTMRKFKNNKIQCPDPWKNIIYSYQFNFLENCTKNGLDINHRDNAGNTILDLYVKDDDENEWEIRRLSSLKANFFSKNSTGKTALHHACERKKESIALLLLEEMKKQKPKAYDLRDKNGNSPLHLLFSPGEKKLICCSDYKSLVSSVNTLDPTILNLQNNQRQTCLHTLIEAAQRFEDLTVKYLLVSGVDWSLCDKQEMNALEFACFKEKKTVLEAFYEILNPESLAAVLKNSQTSEVD